MSTGRRVAIFCVLLVLCGAGVVLAVVSGVQSNDERLTGGSAVARDTLTNAKTDGRPVVVFRSTEGRKVGGQLAVASLGEAAPDERTLEPMGCERVYFASGRGMCVARSKGFAAGYRVQVFDADLRVLHKVDLPGIISRARVSRDGRLGSVTFFVAGHAYTTAGAFSTQTTLLNLQTGARIADLEDFTVFDDDRQITAVDVNFWGVTFAEDGDTFYATLATGGKTYLIRGSVKGRTARVLHENVECPSLSPDQRRIAYKSRVPGEDGRWRLTVLDLATMRETPLAETRSVDDQAEWLDDNTVLYGLEGAIWSVPADGSGRPRRYVADADSPAVVRW